MVAHNDDPVLALDRASNPATVGGAGQIETNEISDLPSQSEEHFGLDAFDRLRALGMARRVERLAPDGPARAVAAELRKLLEGANLEADAAEGTFDA